MGIKKDLSEIAKPPKPGDQQSWMVYRGAVDDSTLSYTEILKHPIDIRKAEVIICRRAFFHPRLSRDEDLIAGRHEWRTVGAIVIPHHAAQYWLVGFRRLMDIPKAELDNYYGKWIYEIQYGRRTKTGERYKAARFSIEKGKDGPAYHVRVWTARGDGKRLATRAGFMVRGEDDPMLEKLLEVLEWAVKYGGELVPAEGAQSVEVEDSE